MRACIKNLHVHVQYCKSVTMYCVCMCSYSSPLPAPKFGIDAMAIRGKPNFPGILTLGSGWLSGSGEQGCNLQVGSCRVDSKSQQSPDVTSNEGGESGD